MAVSVDSISDEFVVPVTLQVLDVYLAVVIKSMKILCRSILCQLCAQQVSSSSLWLVFQHGLCHFYVHLKNLNVGKYVSVAINDLSFYYLIKKPCPTSKILKNILLHFFLKKISFAFAFRSFMHLNFVLCIV